MSEPTELFTDLDSANHIVLMRIYDVLYMLLRSTDPQQASILGKLHEQGLILGPRVSYAEDQDL